MSSQYTYGEWQYINSHEFRGFVRDVYDQHGNWFQESSQDPNYNNPRTQQPVEEVAQQLQRTSLDPTYGSSPPGGGGYTTNVYPPSPPVSKGKGKAKEEPKSSSHKHHSSSKDPSSKGKQVPVSSSSKNKHLESRDSGKSRKHKDDKYEAPPEDPFYADPSAPPVAYSYTTTPEGPGQAQPIDPTYGYSQAGDTKAQLSEKSSGKSRKKDDKGDEDEEAQASVSNIRGDVSAINLPQVYGTSVGSYATSPLGYSTVAQTPYSYSTPTGLAPISEVDPYLGNSSYPGGSYGSYAPISPVSDQKQALASSSKKGKKDWSSGLPETIDPRYVVEPSKKFMLGQVFKILWSEPRGQTTREDIEKMTEKARVKTEFGDVFYISFRRYIVAREDQGHSICVPILTYEGKACSKRGVKPEKHGIIYDASSRERDPSKPLRGEPPLGFKAIKMISTVRDEKLARESRINYSKPMTIEHNVKVFFIGYIPDEDMDTFLAAVEKSWAPKKKR